MGGACHWCLQQAGGLLNHCRSPKQCNSYRSMDHQLNLHIFSILEAVAC